MRGTRVNGERIRWLRMQKGMTQERLAAAADMDVTTLRKMERGSRAFDLRTVSNLAKVLDCEPSILQATLAEVDVASRSRSDEIARGNIQCLRTYRQAFLNKQVDIALECFTHDASLEYPSSIPTQSSGVFRGRAEIREHLRLTFETFSAEIPTLEESGLYVQDQLIILRHVATGIVLHNGAHFASECALEYWFRDGKICRHVGIFDTAIITEALRMPAPP